MENTVAKTIAQQLGQRALVMIGAKNLFAGKTFLQLKLGRNPKGWSMMKIELNELDLYDLTFYKIRKFEVIAEKTVENVYNDMLHDVIESETGLRTSL